MTDKTQNNENKSNILLRTSFWYTISGFLSKGIVFLMLPFYVRFLTKAEYGDYSNLLSWINLISPVVIMNLQLFIMKIQNSEKEELPKYLINSYYASILVLIAIMVPVMAFRQEFMEITQLSEFSLIVIFAYSLLVPIFYLYQGFLRAVFKLKEYVVVNILIALISAALSLLVLIMLGEEQRFVGFVLAQTIPIMVFSVYYLIKTLLLEKRPSKGHLRKSLSIGLPMIPHLLGIAILGKIDRIMITAMIGAEATADYSVANNLALIISTLSIALNNAYVPWQTKQLADKNYASIKKPIYLQILILMFITLGISVLAPEFMVIWAGEKYANVVNILPPLLISVLYTHIYTIFYNIEVFYESKKMIIYSSIAAAIFNVITNYIFINIYGYEAAAFTTLASNLLLVILHYLAVKKIGKQDILPVKKIFVLILISILIIYPMILLYSMPLFKYVILLLAIIVVALYLYRNRNQYLGLIKKFRKR